MRGPIWSERLATARRLIVQHDDRRLVWHLAPMPPPTIAKLKTMNVRRFMVICSKFHCQHSAKIDFAQASIPDEMFFPDIAFVRRFTCNKCGGREISIIPDWTTHKAAGN